MHATARVAGVIGADEANTVEALELDGETVRWTVRAAGGGREAVMVVTDAGVAAYLREVLAARVAVTGGGPGRSRSAA